jgi:hypothetical protein
MACADELDRGTDALSAAHKHYVTTKSAAVLHGCETWARTLREERGLLIQGDANVWAGGARSSRRLEKMHNVVLHNSYSSPNTIRIVKPRG